MDRTVIAVKGRISWADIVADRRARGLDGQDPRLPSNVKAHSELAYVGPGLTRAQATKERARRMKACGCRLCALALNPPLTFADAARFGLVFGGVGAVNSALDVAILERDTKSGAAYLSADAVSEAA